MRAWIPVSFKRPCMLCGHTSWCATSADGVWCLCRRQDTGAGIRKVDKAGAEYWLYRSGAPSVHALTPLPLPDASSATQATPQDLDAVYRALLQALPLAPRHQENLQRRGLDTAQITRGRFRTLPRYGRAALARQLVSRFGPDLCASVPGLVRPGQGSKPWWSLAGAAGLLIPVRDTAGRIVALKVRADDVSGGAKYTYLSSRQHGGPGPGTPVHVPQLAFTGEVLRLTEGELKADIASALSGTLTLGLPGVGMWRHALPVLHELRPRAVLVAFDSDWRSNAHVARAIGELGHALLDAGLEVAVEDWYPAQAKGIDDLLAAGLTPTRRQSFFVYSIYFRGQGQPFDWQMPTIDAREIPPWH